MIITTLPELHGVLCNPMRGFVLIFSWRLNSLANLFSAADLRGDTKANGSSLAL